jgi:hypothetical protein
MWKSGVYHLLPMCHVYIEVKIKLSASECCYLIFWNRFARRAECICLYAPLKDEVIVGTLLVHSTESGIGEAKRTVQLLKMASGGTEENKTLKVTITHVRLKEAHFIHTWETLHFSHLVQWHEKKTHTIFIILRNSNSPVENTYKKRA